MMQQLTKELQRLQSGDGEVVHAVIPLVYEELKKLARAHLRRERGAVSLETTALVHEAFLKFGGKRHPSYESRAHFFGIASRLMRQVLVDAARALSAKKRSHAGEMMLVEAMNSSPQPDRPLLALNDALQRLEATDSLKGQLIEMRYFGGMTAEECSVVLSMPVHKVNRELRLAQAWLRKEMD